MALYSERSQLQDGQEVLDLGCGWGSLSIYIAERYPNSKITSVSNSETQRAFITEECRSVILWLASMSVLPLGHVSTAQVEGGVVHFLIFCVLHGVSKHSHNDYLFGLMKVK